jgi:excisionase family DNA binding protein
MQLTTQQAANLTHRNRSTIYRACKSGRLSAVKDATRGYLIETSELERVFGTLHPMHGGTEAQPMHAPASADASTLLQLELRHIRDQLTTEQVHREEQKQLYERDRQAWQDERTFLREQVTSQGDQLRALTHQPETRRAGWWDRLIGRA